MSAEVWKFRVPGPNEEPWVKMPKGARPLHVAVQDGIPYVWAQVNPHNPPCLRHFIVYGTGQPIDGWPDYLGTFHIDWTVWHVYFTSTEGAVAPDPTTVDGVISGSYARGEAAE